MRFLRSLFSLLVLLCSFTTQCLGLYDLLTPTFYRFPKEDPKPVGVVPVININQVAIDNLINTVRKCRNVPALNLAIVQLDGNGNQQAQYAAGYGVKDRVTQTGTVDANTRFCIGSITKQFTSSLVGAILAENNVTQVSRVLIHARTRDRESWQGLQQSCRQQC